MACFKNRKKQQKKINKIIREINKILGQKKLLAADHYSLSFQFNRYNRKTECLWERVTLYGNSCEPISFTIYSNTNIDEILHYITERIKNYSMSLENYYKTVSEAEWEETLNESKLFKSIAGV